MSVLSPPNGWRSFSPLPVAGRGGRTRRGSGGVAERDPSEGKSRAEPSEVRSVDARLGDEARPALGASGDGDSGDDDEERDSRVRGGDGDGDGDGDSGAAARGGCASPEAASSSDGSLSSFHDGSDRKLPAATAEPATTTAALAAAAGCRLYGSVPVPPRPVRTADSHRVGVFIGGASGRSHGADRRRIGGGRCALPRASGGDAKSATTGAPAARRRRPSGARTDVDGAAAAPGRPRPATLPSIRSRGARRPHRATYVLSSCLYALFESSPPFFRVRRRVRDAGGSDVRTARLGKAGPGPSGHNEGDGRGDGRRLRRASCSTSPVIRSSADGDDPRPPVPAIGAPTSLSGEPSLPPGVALATAPRRGVDPRRSPDGMGPDAVDGEAEGGGIGGLGRREIAGRRREGPAFRRNATQLKP